MYVQFSVLEEHTPDCVNVLHVVTHAKSSVHTIYQEPNPEVASAQTTQLDHHSTSVFAINTNHALGTQFLVATRYKYFQKLVSTFAVFKVHSP